MAKKLPKEVIAYFEEEVINNGRHPEDAFTDEEGNDVDCLKNFKLACVDSHTDRDGDHFEILEIKDKKSKAVSYLKITGYYASYEGTSWDSGEVTEVKKAKKTITDWQEL